MGEEGSLTSSSMIYAMDLGLPDGVSGARERQSEEALPEDREVVVEEILERPVLGRRLVVWRWEPERVVQRRLAGGVGNINVRAEE